MNREQYSLSKVSLDLGPHLLGLFKLAGQLRFRLLGRLRGFGMRMMVHENGTEKCSTEFQRGNLDESSPSATPPY